MKSAVLAVLLALLAWAPPALGGVAEGERAFKAGDHPRAIRELLPLAEQGDIRAQHMLGVIYSKSESGVRDYPLAYRWFTCAATGTDNLSVRAKALRWRDFAKQQMRSGEWQRAQSLARAPCKTREAPAAKTNKARAAGTDAAQSGAAADGNPFKLSKILDQLRWIRPAALFAGDLMLSGIVHLAAASGNAATAAKINQAADSYGDWFTGAISIIWWAVVMRGLYLLYLRSRRRRKIEASRLA